MKVTSKQSWYLFDMNCIESLKVFFAEQHKYELAAEIRSFERFCKYVDDITTFKH